MKKIGDPLQNDFGTLSQNIGLKETECYYEVINGKFKGNQG